MKQKFRLTVFMFCLWLVFAAAAQADTLNIVDGDPATAGVADYTVIENAGSVTITVERVDSEGDGIDATPVSVGYLFAQGSATPGVDYQDGVTSTLTWAASDNLPKTFNSPTIIVDTIPDSGETIIPTLQNAVGATIGTGTATLTINDPQPDKINFNPAYYTVNEGVSIPIFVERVDETGDGYNGEVKVRWSLSSGTATPPEDYQNTSSELTWADNVGGPLFFNVLANWDIAADDGETFTANIEILQGNAFVGTGSALITILDAPAADTISFNPTAYTFAEDKISATVYVERVDTTGNGYVGAVSVQYSINLAGSATPDVDYGYFPPGVLTWGAGEGGKKPLSFTISNDGITEPNETVLIDIVYLSGNAVLGANGAGVTITDPVVPLPAGKISFTAPEYFVTENKSPATITVTRSEGTNGIVEVEFYTEDDNAIASKDYTTWSEKLTWANGESSTKTVKIPIIDDKIYEESESLKLNLKILSGGATIGTSSAKLIITDDDPQTPGKIEFSALSYTFNEGITAQILVQRTGGSYGEVRVDYKSSDGTALAGDNKDYTMASGAFVWADGDMTPKVINLTIHSGDGYENDETLTLTLSNPTGGATIGASATVTIKNIDTANHGILQMNNVSLNVNEKGEKVTIIFTRTNGSDGSVSVNYTTADSTAKSGADYFAKTGTVSWGDKDATNKMITINIIDDTDKDPSETFTVTLSNPSGGATIGAKTSTAVAILDDESAVNGVVQFSTESYTVTENAGTVDLTVNRFGNSSTSLTVNYKTENGTATSGSDYTAVDTVKNAADLPIIFGPNETSKLVKITIADDGTKESSETFKVTLSTADPTSLGSPIVATVTIYDNDVESTPTNAGSLSFSSSTYEVTEGGEKATITVNRTGGTDGSVSVTYSSANGTATAGSDYKTASGTLTFSSGETSKTFDIQITNDTIRESDETVTLRLSSPTGGATLGASESATLTIKDDDAATAGVLQFSAATFSVNENSTAIITVSRTGGSKGVVSVSYATSNGTATAGTDYTAASGTLTWNDGDTANKVFTIAITDDTADDDNETVTLTLSSPTGGATLGTPASATLTIIDNDGTTTAGTLQFSANTFSVDENASATITVTRTGGSQGAASVSYATADGTATAGTDYTAATGTLSWADGDAEAKTFTVTITDDTADDDNETVTLTISNPTGASLGAPASAILTIVDNDGGTSVTTEADTLALDFGTAGLYLYDGTTLTWLNSAPSNMIAWKKTLVADYPGYGLYQYNGTEWSYIHASPDKMIVWKDNLVLDYAGYGLYMYDGANFTWIHISPVKMCAWGNYLALDYGPYGLYLYDGSAWTLLHASPELMTTWRQYLVLDYGYYGLYLYDGAAWTWLSESPDKMEVWKDKLVLDFGKEPVFGVYVYDGTWTWLNVSPNNMAAWGNLLVMDYGSTVGIWGYDGTTWTKMSVFPEGVTTSPLDMVALDLK